MNKLKSIAVNLSIFAIFALTLILLYGQFDNRVTIEATSYRSNPIQIRTSSMQEIAETSTKQEESMKLTKINDPSGSVAVTRNKVIEPTKVIRFTYNGKSEEYPITELPEHVNYQYYLDISEAISVGLVNMDQGFIGVANENKVDLVTSIEIIDGSITKKLTIIDVAEVGKTASSSRFSISNQTVYDVVNKLVNEKKIIIQYGNFVYLAKS